MLEEACKTWGFVEMIEEQLVFSLLSCFFLFRLIFTQAYSLKDHILPKSSLSNKAVFCPILSTLHSSAPRATRTAGSCGQFCWYLHISYSQLSQSQIFWFVNLRCYLLAFSYCRQIFHSSYTFCFLPDVLSIQLVYNFLLIQGSTYIIMPVQVLFTAEGCNIPYLCFLSICFS